jgi:hypothetical protein
MLMVGMLRPPAVGVRPWDAIETGLSRALLATVVSPVSGTHGLAVYAE